MADDTNTQESSGKSSGGLLQRGMNLLFGKPKKGMVENPKKAENDSTAGEAIPVGKTLKSTQQNMADEIRRQTEE